MHVPDNKDEQEPDTKLFRGVPENARRLFAAESAAIKPVEHVHGFDADRCCRWSMKKTGADFAGYPLNVFLLLEDYPERKNHSHTESWIVTTDLTLDFAQAREAAHLRRQIENNEFKRLSHLAGTETRYFKDPAPFFSMLRLFCLTPIAFDYLVTAAG